MMMMMMVLLLITFKLMVVCSWEEATISLQT